MAWLYGSANERHSDVREMNQRRPAPKRDSDSIVPVEPFGNGISLPFLPWRVVAVRFALGMVPLFLLSRGCEHYLIRRSLPWRCDRP